MESLAALAVTGFLLLMVISTAVTVRDRLESIVEHQKAILVVASEADVIRANHVQDLVPDSQRSFFTASSLPESLEHIRGVVTTESAEIEGCIIVRLKLSWGTQERFHESAQFLVCP